MFLIGGTHLIIERRMGMAGRKPKLTNDSSDRKEQRDRTEQLIEKTTEMKQLQKTPPRHLNSYARALWINLLPLLRETKYIKQADAKTVEMLCMNYQVMREAYEDIKENGITKEVYRTVVNPVNGDVITREFSGFKRNPATQILDTTTAKIKSLSESLGLTPASRAQIMNIVPEEDDGDVSMGELLSKGTDF